MPDPAARRASQLCRPDALRRAGRAGRGRLSRRRPHPAAQLLREPRLPGDAGGRRRGGGQVLPPCTLERRADRRGAPLRAGAGRSRGAGGRALHPARTRLPTCGCCPRPGRPRWRCARGPRACTATRYRRARPAARRSWRTMRCWCAWAASSAACMRSARAAPLRTGARWTRRATRARPWPCCSTAASSATTSGAVGRGLRAAIECIDAAFAAHAPKVDPPARRLPPGQPAVARCRRARGRPGRRLHGPGGAGPVDAAVRRARGHGLAAAACCCAATRRSWTSTAPSWR